MTNQTVRLRSKVLLPLGLGFCILLIFGFSATYLLQKRALDDNMARRISNARVLFKELLKVEAEVLGSLAGSYAEIDELQAAFQAGDRDRLQGLALPLFNAIKSRHKITHFYFHTPDKTCYLRVYNPTRHGDKISRFTLDQAARLEAPAYGIELGALGTLTFRLVQPWRVNGKLLGYIELGKEIDQITPLLKHILNLELIFTVQKKRLDRKLWAEGESMLHKPGSWEQFRDFVVVSSSFRQISEELGQAVSSHFAEHGNELFDARQDNRTYLGGTIPLIDAAGTEVGDIFVFANYSHISSSRNLFLIVILFTTLTLAAFYALFTSYLGHIERNLQISVDSLEDEINRHRETTRQLAHHRDRLEVLTRQQSLELAESKTGLKALHSLHICDSCKKVRNAGGEWETLESYLGQQSAIALSHGYCPECARRNRSVRLKE